MAVRIRLRRIGKKKQPQYRLVVAEALGPRDGRFIETIGNYDPRRDPPAITVDEERALTWLRQGAQPTDTVRHMLVRAGVWSKFTGEAPPPAPARPAAPTETETAPAETEAAPAEMEAAPAETETAPTDTETAPTDTETGPAET